MMKKTLLALAAAAVLAGCSTPSSQAPTELEDYNSIAEPDVVWSKSVGESRTALGKNSRSRENSAGFQPLKRGTENLSEPAPSTADKDAIGFGQLRNPLERRAGVRKETAQPLASAILSQFREAFRILLDKMNLEIRREPRRLKADRAAPRPEIPHHPGPGPQFREHDRPDFRMGNHLPGMKIGFVLQTERQLRHRHSRIRQQSEDGERTLHNSIFRDPAERPGDNILGRESEITSGRLYITYNVNEAGAETGIVATVQTQNARRRYEFTYTNVDDVVVNSDASLASIEFNCAYLADDIYEDMPSYTLYIPSDLTVLNIYPVANDANAVCSGPFEFVLEPDQNPAVNITVTASDMTTRTYTFQTVRVSLTQAQFVRCLENGDIDTIIASRPFLSQPGVKIALGAGGFGLALLLVAVPVLRRVFLSTLPPDDIAFFEGEREPNGSDGPEM